MSIWRYPTFCHRGPPLGHLMIVAVSAAALIVTAAYLMLW